MKHILRLCLVISLAVLSIAISYAQSESNATKHYDNAGVAFDYPADWQLTDDGSSQVRTMSLRPAKSEAQIVIRTQTTFEPVRRGGTTIIGSPAPGIESDPCDFESGRKKIADALTEQLAERIQASAARASIKARIGSSDVKGVQLQGLLNNKKATGTIYTVRLNRQFVSLVSAFAEGDARAESAWNTIVSTLTVGSMPLTVLGTSPGANSVRPISGGVLNGKARSLPRPDYPRVARSAHASGVVVIQITIDEAGHVIQAHAISGHPLLQEVSIEAARKAKFAPTKLCGEPVRVTGVLTYNFVAH